MLIKKTIISSVPLQLKFWKLAKRLNAVNEISMLPIPLKILFPFGKFK